MRIRLKNPAGETLIIMRSHNQGAIRLIHHSADSSWEDTYVYPEEKDEVEAEIRHRVLKLLPDVGSRRLSHLLRTVELMFS